MDTKKLFEYESNIEVLRPQLTDDEVMATLKPSDSLKPGDVEHIGSFSIVPGADGIYLKLSDADGNHKKLQFLNPILAKSLAAVLVQNLSMQGHMEESAIEANSSDTYTIH